MGSEAPAAASRNCIGITGTGIIPNDPGFCLPSLRPLLGVLRLVAALDGCLIRSQISRPPLIVITPTTTLIPIPIAIAVKYLALVVVR